MAVFHSAAVRALAAEPGEEPLRGGGLDELLGFQMRMAQLAMYRDFAVAMADLNVTQKQIAILALTDANPGVAQVAIATRLGADRATIMAMVDRLEMRGLIRRVRSTRDRRRQRLYLTDKGVGILATARERIAAHEARFTGRLSSQELQALLAALRRLQGQA